MSDFQISLNDKLVELLKFLKSAILKVNGLPHYLKNVRYQFHPNHRKAEYKDKLINLDSIYNPVTSSYSRITLKKSNTHEKWKVDKAFYSSIKSKLKNIK